MDGTIGVREPKAQPSEILSSDEIIVIPSLARAEIAGAVAGRTGDAASGRRTTRLILRL